MKPGLLVLSFILLALIACKESVNDSAVRSVNMSGDYLIQGKVGKVDRSKNITLSVFDPVSQKKTGLDTTQMDRDGHYQLTFKFEHPELLRVDFPGRQYVMLAVDQGQDVITLNVEGKSGGSVSIEGSEDSQKLLDYDKVRAESSARLISPTYNAMRKAAKSKDGDAEAESVAAYVSNSKLHRKELLDFTEKEIGQSIALYGTVLRWTGDEEIDRLESLVNDFAQKYPDLEMTKAMMDKVARYKKVAIGVKAPNIVSKDENGNDISLYDHLGKVTLIDFWASWCGPCIRQLPDLHKAYNEYADDGFEIFSVSVDTKNDKWLEAIEKYEMNWLHASDVKGWQSPLANDYNVTFVPFNLLLDAEGKIIAKNMHSVSLQETLGDILGAL